MDKQTLSIIAALVAVMGVTGLLVYLAGMPPTIEPSPFDSNMTAETPATVWIPITTPTPAAPDHSADVGNNETGDDDKSAWGVCDARHNASHLYMNGCYGTGGSSSNSSPVQDPIPELPTFALVAVGLLGLVLRKVR